MNESTSKRSHNRISWRTVVVLAVANIIVMSILRSSISLAEALEYIVYMEFGLTIVAVIVAAIVAVFPTRELSFNDRWYRALPWTLIVMNAVLLCVGLSALVRNDQSISIVEQTGHSIPTLAALRSTGSQGVSFRMLFVAHHDARNELVLGEPREVIG